MKTEYKNTYENERSCTKMLQDGQWRLIVIKKQDKITTKVEWEEDGEQIKSETPYKTETSISMGHLVFPRNKKPVFINSIREEDWIVAEELLTRLHKGDYDRVDGKEVKKQEEGATPSLA